MNEKDVFMALLDRNEKTIDTLKELVQQYQDDNAVLRLRVIDLREEIAELNEIIGKA